MKEKERRGRKEGRRQDGRKEGKTERRKGRKDGRKERGEGREGEGREGEGKGRGGKGRRSKKYPKSMVNTTGICDLGCSLEGLPGGQKQQLEIADSSWDLLNISLKF